MRHSTSRSAALPRLAVHGIVCALLISCLLMMTRGGLPLSTASAQNAGANTWLPALNLSNSGSASQPVLAVGGNGTSHVLWWDSFDGMRYLSVPPVITGTLTLSRTRAIVVPGMWNDRQTGVDGRTNKPIVVLTAPRSVRLIADQNNRAHAFWPNIGNQLLYAATTGNANAAWSQPSALADSASAMDVATDISNTLHLVFVRPILTPNSPPGLYYRTKTGSGNWSPATLVYSNTYFRVDQPQDISLGIAANGAGAVVVTWYQARLGQSFFARSSDFGRTWSSPELVSGSAEHTSAQSSAGVGPGGEFLLVYHDPGGRGCGFNQRKSTDAGQTWSGPEVILGDMTRCPSAWRFARSTNKLWLIGSLPQGDSRPGELPDPRRVVADILASWNGSAWSAPAETSLSVFDAAIRQNRALGCLGISIAGERMSSMGCDARNDVWVSQAAISLDKLIVAPDLTWSKFNLLSDRRGPVSSAIVTALTKQNGIFALWPQSAQPGAFATELHLAQWSGAGWLKPSKIVFDPKQKFEEPSVATSPDDKLHLVWNSGKIRYSQAFAREAGVDRGWVLPQDLPLPVNVSTGKSPFILADARNNALLVAYSVPYNEKRGIYLVRSEDGGTTWQGPVQVFDAVSAGWESADQPQIQLDAQSNVLHAVWMKAGLGNRADPQGIYYARSTDGGQSWSKAQSLAEGDVDAPQLALPANGQIYVLWNQRSNNLSVSAPFGTMGRFSSDGGLRWADARELPGFREISGRVSVATDGAGRLYLSGISENAGGASELVYSSWSGQDWSQRETIGIGQQASVGNQTTTAVLPATGQLIVLARTGVLSDSGKLQFEVISTDRKITAAPIVVQPPLTPASPLSATESTTQTVQTPLAEPTQEAKLPTDIPTAVRPDPTQSQMFTFGIIAAVLGVGLLAIGFGFWRSRRR